MLKVDHFWDPLRYNLIENSKTVEKERGGPFLAPLANRSEGYEVQKTP